MELLSRRSVSRARETGAPVRITAGKLPRAVIQWVGPGNRFRLLEPDPYRIRVSSNLGRVPLEIAAGFDFDAASVPRAGWVAISPLELGVIAVLVHDYLYRTGGDGGRLTRAQADKVFAAHMAAEGVSWWRRRVAYWAVRVGGRSSWRIRSS